MANERMVADNVEIVRNIFKKIVINPVYLGYFAVHWPDGLTYFSAEVLAQGLVPKANTKHGNFCFSFLYPRKQISGAVRIARSGRKNNPINFFNKGEIHRQVVLDHMA